MRKTAKSCLTLLLAIVMILSNASIGFAAPDSAAQPGAEEPAEGDSRELEMGYLDPASLGIKKLGEEDEEEEEEQLSRVGTLPTPRSITDMGRTPRISGMAKANSMK